MIKFRVDLGRLGTIRRGQSDSKSLKEVVRYRVKRRQLFKFLLKIGV